MTGHYGADRWSAQLTLTRGELLISRQDCGNGHELPRVVVKSGYFSLSRSVHTSSSFRSLRRNTLQSMWCPFALISLQLSLSLFCQRQGDPCLLQKREKHLGHRNPAHPVSSQVLSTKTRLVERVPHWICIITGHCVAVALRMQLRGKAAT